MRESLRAALLLSLLAGVVPACALYSDPDDPADDDVDDPPDAGAVVDAPLPQVGCDLPLTCAQADSQFASVCGQLRDVETDVAIRVAGAQGEACEPGDTTGPCGLTITPYDALDFAGNPSGATPLPADSITIDTCGRFALRNVRRPQLGFLAVGVDDAAGAPDARRLTARAWPVQSGATLNDVGAYAMRRSTDQLWSAAAGLSPGFVERGVIFAMFRTANGPASGVTIVSSDGARPADDYAFADVDPSRRSQLDMAMTVTGPNGVALMTNSPLVEHTGVGGEPAGCTWQSALASSIPDVLFVLEVWATGADGSVCP